MDFFFFLLLTGVMLLRPEDLSSDLRGANFYLYTIIITTIAAAPKLAHALRAEELVRRPIAVCVLGFLASLVVAAAMSGRWGEVGQFYIEEFLKVVLYYFLLIAVIDSPIR